MTEDIARAPWDDPKPPMLAYLFGACRRTYWEGWKRTTIRTRLAEVSFGGKSLAFDLGGFGSPHLHTAIPGLAIFWKLPRWFCRVIGPEIDCSRRHYGFSARWGEDWGSGSIHLHWGRTTKIVEMPWHLRHDRTEYLATDGNWYSDKIKPVSYRPDAEGPEPWSAEYPYHYMLPDGEVQHPIATVTRRRSFWYRSILGIRFGFKKFESLDIEFSEEVGNQRGSWKGGCIGTSTDMKPGDTPRQALRRMMETRRFDR